jgi:hypothetical protein
MRDRDTQRVYRFYDFSKAQLILCSAVTSTAPRCHYEERHALQLSGNTQAKTGDYSAKTGGYTR